MPPVGSRTPFPEGIPKELNLEFRCRLGVLIALLVELGSDVPAVAWLWRSWLGWVTMFLMWPVTRAPCWHSLLCVVWLFKVPDHVDRSWWQQIAIRRLANASGCRTRALKICARSPLDGSRDPFEAKPGSDEKHVQRDPNAGTGVGWVACGVAWGGRGRAEWGSNGRGHENRMKRELDAVPTRWSEARVHF